MRVSLVIKTDVPNADVITKRVITALKEFDIEPLIFSQDAERFSLSPKDCGFTAAREELFSLCDAVIAVGGDGTIFHAAADAMIWEKPVLGINAGRLGFLAQMELDDLSPLADFVAGRYTVEERLVLEAEIIRPERKKKTVRAINDIVFSRPDFGRVFDIEVCCNDGPVGVYRADGIIFATPTGSTAYSLSAGGPIADPTIDCIIMTPMASHSLVSRSIVFSADKILTAHSPDSGTDAFYLVADGRPVDAVAQNDIVIIRKSRFRTRFICLHGHNFYHILNEKMKRRG